MREMTRVWLAALALGTMMGAPPALAEHEVGNGGDVIVCFNADGSLRSI